MVQFNSAVNGSISIMLLRFMAGYVRIILVLTLYKVPYMVQTTTTHDKESSILQFGENDTFQCHYFCYTTNNTGDYFPPKFTDKCPPPEVLQAYISPEDESGVEVFWTEPVAEDTDGNVTKIEQVVGDQHGSYFNGSAEGTIYNIVYLAKDKDGLRDNCHFEFKVYDKVICNTPVEVENGFYVCTNDTRPGSVCTYNCNEGYRVTGKTDVTCQSGYQTFPVWSSAPTCKVIHCVAPKVPKDGNIYCIDSTYSYNSICSVTCDKGFSAEGPHYMICQIDGLWSRSTSCTYPEPLAVHCISPQIFYPDSKQTSMEVNWLPPSSAAIDKNMIEVNQIIGPTQGDKLESGLYTVVYQMTSRNSEESSECRVDLHVKVIICEHPANIFNDSFIEFNCSSPTFILGVMCEISCKENLEITGNTSITCVANEQQKGVWDWGPEHMTICNDTLTFCPEVFDKPINGQIIYNKTDTLTEVKVICENEFDLQYKFLGYVSCVDGEWTSYQIPECNVIKKPNYLLNAELHFFGKGFSENVTEYNDTLQSKFDEYIVSKCPENETCKVTNVRVELINRSTTQVFVLNITIEIDSNKSHNSLDNHKVMLQQLWVNCRNLMIADVLQMLQKPENSTIDHFKVTNTTVPRCDDNHILEGSLCRTCSVGYFYNKTSDGCQNCPIGTFKDTSGSASCLICTDGTSSKDEGSMSVNDCKKFCRPGSFSSDGLVTCAVCQKGFYQDEFRQTECKKCPDGTTTILANSTNISQCTVTLTNDSCMTSSCNGHRCLSKNESISCVCSYGWSGNTCEQPPLTCADNICMDEAKCIGRNNSYTCECQADYTGSLCEITPVNGGWTEWSGWSKCSVTCDQGIQQRERQCKNPSPSEYGDNCYGQLSQDKVCVRNECQACQKLRETNSSYHQCKIDRETGLETCSVRCKDGLIIGSWADGFRNLSCGIQTGFYWLPANISLHCSEPMLPEYLLLKASIEYEELIPNEYHNMSMNYVRDRLLKTDCFKSTRCKLKITLGEVNTLNSQSFSYKRTKLYSEFRRNLQHNVNNAKEVGTKKGLSSHEWKDAIEDMESTAEYLNEFTNEVYDIKMYSYFNKSSKKAFIAVKTSLYIQGSTNCENGQGAADGICTECTPGTYSYGGTCHFCIKGTYQPNSGQTTCILCPPDLTTDTIGANDVSQCIQCSPGKYDYEGTCHFCIKGTYQPDSGQNTCIFCPPGLTTERIGAIHLSQCKYAIDKEAEDSDLTVTESTAIVIASCTVMTLPCACYACYVKVMKHCSTTSTANTTSTSQDNPSASTEQTEPRRPPEGQDDDTDGEPTTSRKTQADQEDNIDIEPTKSRKSQTDQEVTSDMVQIEMNDQSGQGYDTDKVQIEINDQSCQGYDTDKENKPVKDTERKGPKKVDVPDIRFIGNSRTYNSKDSAC